MTAAGPAVIDLKSASLTLEAVVIKSADLDELAAALDDKLGGGAMFDQDPVVIDLGQLSPSGHTGLDTPLAFDALVQLLRRHGMLPVAVRGGTPAQHAAARQAGLGEAAEGGTAPARTQTVEVLREVEVVREVPVEVRVEVPGPAAPTLVIDKPLRSGQQAYARGGDLVVLAAVNPGAEVIADGHIHVYAPLRGKAIAGAKGNAEARIFALHLEAELVAIAGTYRTTETPLPAEVVGRAAQVRLDGDRLVFERLD